MRIAFIIADKDMPWDSVHQGVGYVAAYANKHLKLEDCQVFRTHDKEEQDLLEFLQQKWDVIGLTITDLISSKFAYLSDMYPMNHEVAHLCEMIKSMGTTKIVVGGAGVTTLETEILDKLPNVDYAITGEGEITFYELLKCLANDGNFSNIKGLIYRDSQGNICQNSPRGFEKNLELFPYPDRTLFQYPYDFHSIIGTRGCPFQCTFCNSSDNWGRLYRRRNPKVIAEEFQYILELYGHDKYIAFNDDLFNIKKDWVLEVCQELKPLGAPWWIRGLRADFITEEIADSLAEAGCFGAACGIESANNNALKSMRKVTTIEKTMQGVELLKSRGINVTAQFIIGNQGDTLETVKESIECAHHFSDASFGVAYPIFRTFLYDYVINNHYLLPQPVPVKHKGKTIDVIVFDTPHFPAEERLKAVELAIEAKFYHGIEY